MTHRNLLAGLSLILAVTWASGATAHCQVPCGIYDDEARVLLIEEHVGTIEKSMVKVEELSAADHPDLNQVSRWVANKDHHADELVHIVTYYFMSQRLKPADLLDDGKKEVYLERLTLLHEMMVHAMKAKQTTDRQHIDTLRELLAKFEIAYFGHEVER